MAGSGGSGDDIEAGRTNFAESTTVVQGGRPDDLDVGFNGLAVFEAGPRRDVQDPAGTLSGILGRGWNGANPGIEPGAGVIGVGAPNRGPGMVGLGGGVRISSTFLGSPGNLGETGLGGTGLIGFGGPGQTNPDGFGTSSSLPGAGVVGQGGTSFFETPTDNGDPGTGNGAGVVGIAGGRLRAPDANLSQGDLAAAANVGVVGFGGDGPKPAGAAGPPFIGPKSAGAGVRGIGGDGRIFGPGVVGVAGDVTPIPPDTAFSNFGVAGVSAGSVGVSGTSTLAAGVSGDSTQGVGVAGSSVKAVGGYFASQEVAQIHLEPLSFAVPDPNGKIVGRAGDLLVVRSEERTRFVRLYFCRSDGNMDWQILA